MTYADSTERTALISGLHGLADYLESNPDVPTPVYSDMLTFPPDGKWEEVRAEIDAIAARLDATAYLTGGGHYCASRWFGPVEYRVVAIPRKNDSSKESE